MNGKSDPESIFAEAIAIASPQARAAFLDGSCASDPNLRQEVEKLVADYFRAGQFLERPDAQIATATLDQPPLESPGTQIGPYKLMEQIGEGGMGRVFVAEQHQPVRRKVALKLIKPGMDTREVIARFEAERQALALMDHPNIARVLDAGATASGRPYFVMELVKGVPITQFCDDNRLTPRERLDLFTHVCHAVQHAHQKGIICRDIKPTNVMVTSLDGRPVVKVIDFGVAKAYGQAQAILRQLTVDYPAVPDNWQTLGVCLRNLGSLLRTTARPREAEETYEQALAIHQRLVDEFPDVPLYRQNLAGAYNNLAMLLGNTGRGAKAEKPFREALAIDRKLAAEFPADPEYKREVERSCINLASLLKELKRNKEAEELLLEALAICKPLAADFPSIPGYRQDFARTCNELGTVLRAVDRLDEAEDFLRQALALHRQLAADFRDRPDHQNEAAGTMVNLGRLLYTRGDFVGARRLFDEALPYHQALMKGHPSHPTYLFFYRNNRWRLAETLLALKDHAAAADAAGQFLQAATDPPRDAYTAGCLLAGCARLAEQDTQLAEAERRELAGAYADRAVATLRLALDRRYEDIDQLRNAPELDSLRSRDDFKKLLSDSLPRAPSPPHRRQVQR